MSEEIEILEKFIKNYKEVQEKYKSDEIQAEIERSCYFEEVPYQALENLINRNKELEAINFGTEEIKRYNKKHFIDKDKIKEIIKDVDETMGNIIEVETKIYMLAVKNSLLNLLEE